MQITPPSLDQAIETQTQHVFSELISSLESQDLEMADLMKLHTYYVYDGEGSEVTDYWEKMTAVRLRYLHNPGPAATALRVSGLWRGGPLIGIDGIGETSTQRTRLMPKHRWDWSIPTPFSQGWLVDDKVYVGGQISADMHGKAVAPGDVITQSLNTLEFIQHVLLEGGADWDDVVSVKVAFKCTKNDREARQTLQKIIDEMDRVFKHPKPALVCFGVDLLYEGLLLEIDAVAVKNRERKLVAPPGSELWASGSLNYTPAWLVGDELYIGGQSAPGGASVTAQMEATMTRIGNILAEVDADYGDLVKLNVFYCNQNSRSVNDDLNEIGDVLESFLDSGKTVISIVQVPGLAHPGQRVEIDGIAVMNQQN
jgi:enamine deaminase RidA (YjgF/YER057c/UK114 family)